MTKSSEAAAATSGVRGWIERRVVGQRWYLRAPLLLPLGWIFYRHLSDPLYFSVFDGVNLAFHEAGHAAFSWLGHDILTTAGGTIFELGIPVAAGAYLLWKQRDPFGAAVCLFWLGTALVSVGVYAADARAQALPLVSPFGAVDPGSHDWTTLLMKFGKLSRDQEIGAAFRGAGLLSMAFSLGIGGWLLGIMAGVSGGGLYDRGEEARLAEYLGPGLEGEDGDDDSRPLG